MYLSFCSVLLCFLILIRECQSTTFRGTWSLAHLQPNARRRFGLTCTADTIFVVGGERSDSMISSAWRYNLADARWTMLHPAGEFPALQYHTISFVFPNLYVFGGTTTGTIPTRNLFVLDVSSTNGTFKNTWLALDSVGPVPRMRHKAVIAGTSLFFFFGRGTDRLLNSVWSFETTSRVWIQAHEGGEDSGVPSPRFDSCCKYWSDRSATLCFGGMTSRDDANDFWIFFHSNFTWRQILVFAVSSVVPEKRHGHVCGIRNNVFFIFGGFVATTGKSTENSVYQVDMSVYPLQPLKWVISPQSHSSSMAPRSRDGAAMCDKFNGTTMLFGGIDDALVYHNDLWSLEKFPNTSLYFRSVHGDATYPKARSGAIAKALGTSIVYGTGRLESTAFADDIWLLNTETYVWKKLSDLGASPYPGRYGSAAVVRGQLVVFFGGAISEMEGAYAVSSDLLTFDTESVDASKSWKVVTVTKGTDGRMFHGMANFDTLFVVMGGMKPCGSTALCSSNDVIVYDPSTERWSSMTISNMGDEINALPTRYAMGFIEYPADKSILVMGGLNEHSSLNDRIGLALVVKGKDYLMQAFPIETNTSNLTSDRLSHRGGAVTVASGFGVLTCGGLMSRTEGVDDEWSCFEYNMITNENTVVAPLPRNVYFPSGVYIGKKVIVIGGALQSGAVPMDRDMTNDVQILDLDSGVMCRNGDNLMACAMCSSGSSNTKDGTCTFTPPGTYQRDSFLPAVLCPAGTFSPTLGANDKSFCRYCDAGLYAPTNGSGSCIPCPQGYVCPIGAPEAYFDPEASLNTTQSSPAYSVPTLTYDVQLPKDFREGETPVVVYIVVALLALFAVAIVSSMYYISNRRKWKKINFCVPDELQAQMKEIFLSNATPNGLECSKVIPLLSNASQLQAVLRGVDDAAFHHVVDLCNANGTNTLGLAEFMWVLVLLVENNHIAPFANTRAASRGCSDGTSEPIGDSFNLAEYDVLNDVHRNIPFGEPIRLCRTTLGGSVSIFHKVLVLLVVGLMFTMFTYDNIFETKTVLPAELVDLGHIVSDFTFTFEILGSPDTSLCYDETPTENISSDAPSCNPYITVTVDNLKSVTIEQTCEFVPPDGCVVKWACTGCTFKGSIAWVNVTYHPNSFSTETYITLDISSGVMFFDGGSSLTANTMLRQWYEPSEGYAFRGNPATIADVTLTPTLFESPRTSYDNNKVRNTGFHLKYNPESKSGNQVAARSMGQYYGVPIAVKLSQNAFVLSIKRVFKQPVLGFLMALLGAVSGLGGGMIALLKILEALETMYGGRKLEQYRLFSRPVNCDDKDGLRSTYSEDPAPSNAIQEDNNTLDTAGSMREEVAPRLIELKTAPDFVEKME